MINSYDICVENKEINGKQCTIAWYVDDNIISHNNKYILDRILYIISREFRELIITKGNEHIFLGMKINIRKDKRLILV